MAKIALFPDENGYALFDGEQYIIETNRSFSGYEPGDIICDIAPFFGIPLKLEIAIRKSGELIFRRWFFISPSRDGTGGNPYLHTYIPEIEYELVRKEVTQEQRETVNGLFSGRIRFEGLRLPVGATLQKICPIDVEKEEALTGKKIWLN